MRLNSPIPVHVVSFLALAVAGCGPSEAEPNTTTPEEIRGVWASDNANYAGRDMEILEEAFLFDTGDGAFEPYIIRGIVVEQEDDGTLYDFEYSGWEGGILNFSFKYRPGDSTIVFKNQPRIVWRRKSPER